MGGRRRCRTSPPTPAPCSLDDGRLVVEVDEPGWATQLRYLEADLLERLAAVAGAGAVRSIEVRVTPPLTARLVRHFATPLW